MRATYSKTAQSMAIFRALEYCTRPAAERIISDPWALRFIPNPVWRAIAAVTPSARLLSAVVDRWLPGAQEYSLARARLVDDTTRELAANGLEQLVLLGAGFDTTVLRLQHCLKDVRIFEVDHPATQSVKKSLMRHRPAPASVHYLPVDFEKESFAECLRAGGFDRSRSTLVTWLGVSYYLSAAAVEKTLAQARELLGPGHKLIFDHVPPELIQGRAAPGAARNSAREVARLGEPFLFGLDPAEVPAFVSRFGFKVLAQYDWRRLQERYCGLGRTPVDFMFIACCESV
jgi:methyltransferase (TIGR00027 family)